MAVEVIEVASNNKLKIDPSWRGLRTSIYPPEALGHYRLCATSGILTGVAAGTATAGFLFAMRAPASNLMVVQRIKARLWTLIQPTATLEQHMKLLRLTGYTGNITGGTTIPLTSPQFKKTTAYPSTTIQAASIATTAGLTAGTHTLDTNEFASGGMSEAAAAEATSPNQQDIDYWGNEAGEHGMVYTGNEGFIVRNEILWSAAATGRLAVTVDWFELAAPATRW